MSDGVEHVSIPITAVLDQYGITMNQGREMKEENRYVAWFKTIGDPKWYTNHKEWDTYDQAFIHAEDKIRKWSQAELFCVVKTGDDPNETKGEFVQFGEHHWSVSRRR